MGSPSTGRYVYTEKRETYAEYGVGEYWRFDHSGGKYHDAPLAGDRLVNGEYEPIEIVDEADGRHRGYSETLGLEFWWIRDESPGWNTGELRFRDPVSGEFLQTYEEIQDTVESERAARMSAQQHANMAQQRAEAAEVRMAEMEAELGRLRGE